MGLGAKAIFWDLGVNLTEPIVIKSDASAAIAVANRIGIGKVRHIEVSQLWLQQEVYRGNICIEKVSGTKNLADALTKAVDGKTLRDHIEAIGAQVNDTRHPLAPKLEYEGNIEEEGMQGEEDHH